MEFSIDCQDRRKRVKSRIRWLCSVILLAATAPLDGATALVQGTEAFQVSGASFYTRQRHGQDGRHKSNAFHAAISNSVLYSSQRDDGSLDKEMSTMPSLTFSMDPASNTAKVITSRLDVTEQQHALLSELALLVVEWNHKINLVSRRDCTVDVVFGRHVLPSVAIAALSNCPLYQDNDTTQKPLRVVDVGTGGGFPGLPLAIMFPNVQFVLVDSVGKKLKAVQDMAEALNLDNVQVHHGRAEDMVDIDASLHRGAYDVCVGRSVATLPKFCFWMQDLIRRPSSKDDKGGELLYIVGGDIEESLLSQTISDTPIDELLDCSGASDKRILVFYHDAVSSIASTSGEVKRKRGPAKPKPKASGTKMPSVARGHWIKRDNSRPKQRGYDSFKRYGE